MSYTFATLQTEFFARGFDYLSDGGAGLTRAKQWVNDGYHALCEEEQWPFLETTATGTAPLTISDLRQILYVVDTTNDIRLREGDARDVVDLNPEVATTGTPSIYWLDGLTTLRVYPTNTSNALSVRYLKVPTDLSADGDVPVVPGRYRNLIVDYAVCKALEDSSNHEEAARLRGMMQLDLDRMRRALLERAGDDPDFIVQYSAYDAGCR